MASPGAEKHLEEIYHAVLIKGHAIGTVIAKTLHVSLSSVTKMVRKLSEEDYLHYHKYGEIRLANR